MDRHDHQERGVRLPHTDLLGKCTNLTNADLYGMNLMRRKARRSERVVIGQQGVSRQQLDNLLERAAD
jgi:hypothetical protein